MVIGMDRVANMTYLGRWILNGYGYCEIRRSTGVIDFFVSTVLFFEATETLPVPTVGGR